MVITKLLVSELLHRKMRSLLTVSAVAAAVSLVVAMTTGFASLRATVHQVLGQLYGEIDVVIEPVEGHGPGFDQTLLHVLERDPRVASFRPQLIAQSFLLRSDGRVRTGRPARLVGVHPAGYASLRQHPLRGGRWLDQESGAVAVVDDAVVRRLGTDVGGTVSLPTPDGAFSLTVVGVAARPSVVQMDAPTIHLPLRTLQEFLGKPGQVNLIEIDLKSGVDPEGLTADLQKLQSQVSTPFRIKTVASQRENFDRNFEGVELLIYIGGSLSMLSAVFIIFSTLTMGVTERSRLLAVLRAIGAETGQVVRLVVGEGLLLALAGSLAGVGLGYLWVWLLYRWEGDLFSGGIKLSWGGIGYGVLGSVSAALLASLLPAYTAARTSALEAMAVVSRPAGHRLTVLSLAVGLALIAVDPLVVHVGGLDRQWRILIHIYLGLPCVFLGLFALSPAIVWLVDRLLSVPIAWVLGLQPALLRQQLGGGLWRSAGTATALMVGLLALVLIRVHGNAMISGWQLPDRFPDMLLFAPLGLDDAQAAQLDTVQGLKPGQVLTVAVVSPKVDAQIFSIGGLAQTPDATMLFGTDPQRAFGPGPGGGPPMIELQFIEGDQATAARKLGQGRNIVVSEEFKKLKGLGVGGKLPMQTPLSGQVQYTIIGVVRSPGIDMVVRIFQMQQEFEQWTAAGAMTSLENVKKDFGVSRYNLFAANLDTDREKKDLERDISSRLGAWGLLTADARRVKKGIDFVLRRLLDLLSSVALMAMLVASVGVTNTVMASIRSRQWQFGVLRSIGLTRGALVRLVIAEAAMIALVAIVMGLGGGLLLSVNAHTMTGYITGVQPPLVIIPGPLWLGAGVTLAIPMAAAVLPALRVGMSDTLRLLQSGRNSA